MLHHYRLYAGRREWVTLAFTAAMAVEIVTRDYPDVMIDEVELLW